MIETFKEKQKEGEYMKLPGLYILNMKDRRLVCLDLISSTDADLIQQAEVEMGELINQTSPVLLTN